MCNKRTRLLHGLAESGKVWVYRRRTGGAVFAPLMSKKRGMCVRRIGLVRDADDVIGKVKVNGDEEGDEGQVKKVKETPAKPRGTKARRSPH